MVDSPKECNSHCDSSASPGELMLLKKSSAAAVESNIGLVMENCSEGVDEAVVLDIHQLSQRLLLHDHHNNNNNNNKINKSLSIHVEKKIRDELAFFDHGSPVKDKSQNVTPRKGLVSPITTSLPIMEKSNSRTNSGGRRGMRRQGIDPKRLVLIFATLSSMGTLLLIFFTLAAGRMNGGGLDVDEWGG